jgi:short subunit fatty acids transporter
LRSRWKSVLRVIDAYHQGLWMLLPFTMQMTLILVLSLALATTPFPGAIARLARAAPGTSSSCSRS